MRTFCDGTSEDQWSLEILAVPDGTDKTERAMVATTKPSTLSSTTTFYLVTNPPAPRNESSSFEPKVASASLEQLARDS